MSKFCAEAEGGFKNLKMFNNILRISASNVLN